MLKRHQMCIDLSKNVLKIHDGEEVPFLPEHELPDNARAEKVAPESPTLPTSLPSVTSVTPASTSTNHASAPVASCSTVESKYPEESIKGLIDLGVSRQEAIAALDACDGNLDVAASMIFQ